VLLIIGISAADADPVPPAAAAQDRTTNATTVPNSSDNYDGDILFWHEDVELKDSAGGMFTHCLPPGKAVVGTKSGLDPDPNTGTQWQAVRLYHGAFSGLGPGDTVAEDKQMAALNCHSSVTNGVSTATAMNQAGSYYVSSGDASRASRIGFDYGALVVPFKLQLGEAKNFSGAASVGPYLGFRIPVFNVVIDPVIFGGASAISVSSTDQAGTTSSQTLAGLSYGAGIIGIIKGSFSVGLIFGADHVDDSAHYAYNDKLWTSLEIGYSFTQ
jgi:hypothetical protein